MLFTGAARRLLSINGDVGVGQKPADAMNTMEYHYGRHCGPFLPMVSSPFSGIFLVLCCSLLMLIPNRSHIGGNVLGEEKNNIYNIEWLKEDEPILGPNGNNYVGPMMMQTAQNESYNCYVPLHNAENVASTKFSADTNLESPQKILEKLFNENICVFRVETYWTYQLCHGKFLRQFHQETVPEKNQFIITKEYVLGKYEKNPKEFVSVDSVPYQPLKLDLDGKLVPYFEVVMDDGTPCDIKNDEPRMTLLRYICVEGASETIKRLRESATCEYEVIVASSMLCRHPGYKPVRNQAQRIRCYSASANVKPRSLMEMENEMQLSKSGGLLGPKTTKSPVVGQVNVNPVIPPGLTFPEQIIGDEVKHPPSVTRTANYFPDQKELLENLLAFLEGKFCVHGGTGYWRHAFCYGKTVIQYHEEKGATTRNEHVITLGIWDLGQHVIWLADKPRKRPVVSAGILRLTHFYQDGDVCDLTGKPRTVEVNIRCVKSASQSSSAVVLYLIETKPCVYTLGVESAMFCLALNYVDNDGIVDIDALRKSL